MRKFFTALVLIPLGVIFLAFAIANRRLVTVSFDPFNATDPSVGVTLPLFMVIIVVAILGVLAGSFVTSLATSRFKWDGYTSPSHMIRSIGGAALMGSGGAMALGCSVGQGLTGVSTLALASFLAITGIVVGAAVGLRGPLQVRALASA